MTNEELQKIIEQFDEDELKKLGVFGIYQYGGGPEESFIKANKEGLELYALELLKCARETESILNNDNKRKLYSLDIEADFIDQNSQVFIHYIEPIAEKQNIDHSVYHKSTVMDKLLPFGCLIIFIIILISIVVGLITMKNYFF